MGEAWYEESNEKSGDMSPNTLRREGRGSMGTSQQRLPLRGRVLVIDDDPSVRAFLSEFLEQEAFEVRIAQDGMQALTIFRAESFDLILVDFQMPGMSGLEVAAEVRKTHPHIPIALITGTAKTLNTDRVARAGITRIFQKPFDLEVVTHWIRSLSL
jgi:DNA-binding response OmpR family regulator